MITILDWAKYRGAQATVDGQFDGDALGAVGFAILGGCARCGAQLAAYNAYPTKSGVWACKDCVGDFGFATAAEAEAFEFERLMSSFTIERDKDGWWDVILDEEKCIARIRDRVLARLFQVHLVNMIASGSNRADADYFPPILPGALVIVDRESANQWVVDVHSIPEGWSCCYDTKDRDFVGHFLREVDAVMFAALYFMVRYYGAAVTSGF